MKAEFKDKISVIIPVYNSEEFIRECIDSILNQTYNNFEIICVNDGSVDNSKDIILEYIKRFPLKIRLINQKNQGSGIARNTGIDNSNGEFIIFIDSDDVIHREMFDKLFKNINEYKSDIAICGFQRINEDTNKVLSNDMINHNYKSLLVNKDDINHFLFINPGPCNKIHRKTLFEKARFSQIPVVDDLMLMLEFFPVIKRVSFVKEILYFYKVRKDSSSNTLKYETLNQFKNNMLSIKKEYINMGLPNYYFDFLDKITFIHVGVSMFTKLSFRKNKNMLKEIKSTKIYLDLHFKSWRNISLFEAFKSQNLRYIGLYILIFLYKINLFFLFIKIYKFMNNYIKRDIKW